MYRRDERVVQPASAGVVVQVLTYVQAHAQKMAALLQKIASQNSILVCRCGPVLSRAALHAHARTCRHLHVAAAAAAARRVGSTKQKPSKSQLFSPVTAAGQSALATQAAHISALSALNASHTHGNGLQTISQLLRHVYALDPMLQRLGLLGPSRRNYRAQGGMILDDSLRLLVRRFRKVRDLLLSDTAAECSDLLGIWQAHPRWLGAIPRLVEEFDSEARDMEPEQAHKWVKKWLMEHPEALAGMGLKPSDLGKGNLKSHIDHILPHCKAGCSHPMNYVIMEASLNQSFSGYISLEKCRYVGLRTVLAVIKFHAQRLPSASLDQQSLQLAMVPVFPTFQ